MRWKIGKTRTPKVKRAATICHGVEQYCRNLDAWPQSWMGLEKDLLPGQQLLTFFRPFLEHLAALHLPPKTIQRHVDNMWVLGGEFIRDLHFDPPMRKKPVKQVLLKLIEYGGPLLYHGGEAKQSSLDSTCRKFRTFLDASTRQLANAPSHPQIPPTRLVKEQ